MSLTREDLQQLEAIFGKKLDPVLGELTALREDIKEIYSMISDCLEVSLNYMTDPARLHNKRPLA